MKSAIKNRMPVNIAIVEDDAPARKIFAGWIDRSEGLCCIGEHGNGAEAVDGLVAQQPNVVLMDINLPGMNGIECVRRLKPVLPKTQFVMLTVYEDADHIFQALAAGASGYLLKQIPKAQLLAALRDVYEGGSPMTSKIARKVVQAFQAPRGSAAETEELSPRETELLDLLARGYLYKEIADAMSITVGTVNTFIRRIYEKLHVRSRSQAVAKARPHLLAGILRTGGQEPR
jgi:DNA-binding NarL/FixJ family response regulator